MKFKYYLEDYYGERLLLGLFITFLLFLASCFIKTNVSYLFNVIFASIIYLIFVFSYKIITFIEFEGEKLVLRYKYFFVLRVKSITVNELEIAYENYMSKHTKVYQIHIYQKHRKVFTITNQNGLTINEIINVYNVLINSNVKEIYRPKNQLID